MFSRPRASPFRCCSRRRASEVAGGAPLWQWGVASLGSLIGIGYIYRRQIRRALRQRGWGADPSVRVRAPRPSELPTRCTRLLCLPSARTQDNTLRHPPSDRMLQFNCLRQ